MTLLVPKFDDSYYSQQVTLNGEVFKLEFKYNIRQDFWTIDISRRDGTPLVQGRKVVVDFPLFTRFGYKQDMPLGEFFLNDSEGTTQEATRQTFLEQYLLTFFTDEEILAIE